MVLEADVSPVVPGDADGLLRLAANLLDMLRRELALEPDLLRAEYDNHPEQFAGGNLPVIHSEVLRQDLGKGPIVAAAKNMRDNLYGALVYYEAHGRAVGRWAAKDSHKNIVVVHTALSVFESVAKEVVVGHKSVRQDGALDLYLGRRQSIAGGHSPRLLMLAIMVLTMIVGTALDMTPTILLHLGAGYQEASIGQVNFPQTNHYDVTKELGIRGPFTTNLAGSTFPDFNGATSTQTGGLPQLGNTSFNGQTQTMNQRPTGIATLTWVKNNHTYKFGGGATWLGGSRILSRLERSGFDVERQRPVLGASDLPWILARLAVWRML